MGPTASLITQRRRFRIAVPAALLVLVVFGLLLEPWFPWPVREAASSAGLLLVALTGVTSCAVRARQTTGRRHRSWLLLIAAGVSGIVSNAWVAVSGSDPVESPSTLGDLLLALALIFAIAALLSFPTVRRRGIDLLLLVLDGIVIAAGVLIIASILVYAALTDPGRVTDSQLTPLLLPVLDVVLATVALLLVLRSGGADRPVLALVAAGFVMYTAADLSFAVRVADGDFRFGSLPDLGWIAGYAFITLAAWYPSTQDEGPEDDATGASDARDTLLVYSITLVAAVVQVAFSTEPGIAGAQAVIWLVLILAAGVRQTLLTYDNAALRRGLEQRVREQTADLRRLARQTEVLVSSVGDGIYGVDLSGRITFVNPSGAQALGSTPEDLLGRHAHEDFHGPAADGTPYPVEQCYVTDAIISGRVASAEQDEYRRANGELFPVEITASPLVDGDDHERIRGAVVVFRDMTHRREIDRMKNEFVSVVSHELRTPLTSIRGALGLLATGSLGELSPRAQSMTTIALESSERLTRLINDILDLERIESGSRRLELATHEARDLLVASADEMAALARDHGMHVEVGTAHGVVVADRDRVVQTLTNLIGNAIKFSAPGDVVVLEARPGTGLEQDTVVFSVRDQGRGIPEEKLATVFERFQQVDSSDARQKGGTGLGLTISRGIVERHGGRIWAESEVGSGTTLRFTLPTPRRSRLPDQESAQTGHVALLGADPATTAAWTARLGAAGHRLSGDRPPAVVVLGPASEPITRTRLHEALDAAQRAGGTALLLEPDERISDEIGRWLSERGVQVASVPGGVEAHALVERLEPSFLVVDLERSWSDALGVVADLRARIRGGTATVLAYRTRAGARTPAPVRADPSDPAGSSPDRTEVDILGQRLVALMDIVTARMGGGSS
jgi:PAS domain S-box-containing protein